MLYSSEFGINGANDFFNEIVRPQYGDFLKDNASRRHALLTIIVAYHLFEWVHPRKKFSIEFFEATYPNDVDLAKFFDLARKIANGTKHSLQRTKTRRQAGFSSEFSDEFARPLIVVHSDGQEQSVDDLLHQMMNFWTNQLN